MHTDNGPVWLQIIIAIIPLAAAIIGGIFLLTNTINRRVERFKNLAEASKIDVLGPKGDHLLRDIIIHQLTPLWRDTTPALKRAKRLRRATLIPLGTGYIVYALRLFHRIDNTLYQYIFYTSFLAAALLAVVSFVAYKKADAYLDNTLDRFNSLDAVDKRDPPRGIPHPTSTSADDDHVQPPADRDQTEQPSVTSGVTRFPALSGTLAVKLALAGVVGWSAARLSRRRAQRRD